MRLLPATGVGRVAGALVASSLFLTASVVLLTYASWRILGLVWEHMARTSFSDDYRAVFGNPEADLDAAHPTTDVLRPANVDRQIRRGLRDLEARYADYNEQLRQRLPDEPGIDRRVLDPASDKYESPQTNAV
jgi:hypothetical protein